MKGGESVSVGPITPQEVEQHYLPVFNEIYTTINEILIDRYDFENVRFNVNRDIIEATIARCENDSERARQLSEVFESSDWIYKIISDYEAVGWKVEHDYIIAGLPRLVFTRA